MKMVMISYNSAIDIDVMEALRVCGIENYTKWTQVQGRGTMSGPHFGTEIWPGENCVLFAALDNRKCEELLEKVGALRTTLGREGVKAFVWPLESVT